MLASKTFWVKKGIMRALRISFFALLLAGLATPLSAFAQETNSTVTGTIKFSKRVTQPGFETGFGTDAAIEDPAARSLPYAFVYLEPTSSSPQEPTSDPDDEKTANMQQRGYRFVPLVMVVQAGQPVIFSSSDPMDHNVRSITENKRNLFNVITTRERSYEKRFQAQGNTSPLRLACDFHPSMEAWIYIVDHHWHAVTDEEGKYTIKNVAPGEYTVNVVQPRLRLRAKSTFKIDRSHNIQADATFGLRHRYFQEVPPLKIKQLKTH
jgi:plastocyanin